MNAMKTQNHMVFGILLVAVMLLTAIPAVSAAPTAILLSPADPNNVHTGDVVSIQVAGLPGGDAFKYRITSSDMQMPGNSVSLSSINMPFAFTSGSSTTTLITTGVTMGSNPLTVKYAGTEYKPPAVGNTVTAHQNIKAGNYDVTIAVLTKTATLTGIDYSVEGTVSGAQALSTLSFALPAVNSGHFTVEVIDNGATLLTQTFTIPVPATPIPDNGGSEGYGGSTGGAGAAQEAPPAQLAPVGILGTAATILHNEEGKVLADYTIETDSKAGFSSALDVKSGATVVAGTPPSAVGLITITPLDPAVAPGLAAAQGGVYSFSGFSVECEPSGAQFSGAPVTLTFTLTPAQWAEALAKVDGKKENMVIQFYDAASQTWIDVPTVVDPVTLTVSAQITHFSTYALFYKPSTESAVTPTLQTYGSLVSPTPATTAVAPVTTAAKTQLAPPSTTQSPLPGFVVVGAIGLVGLYVVRKKE